MTPKIILEIIGWFGGISLIIAYALNSYGIIDANSLIYQFINLAGSVALTYYTFKKEAYPNVALNIVWASIAIVAIYKILN